MEKSIYIGKNKEDLLNLALYELNVNKEDIIFIEKSLSCNTSFKSAIYFDEIEFPQNIICGVFLCDLSRQL